MNYAYAGLSQTFSIIPTPNAVKVEAESVSLPMQDSVVEHIVGRDTPCLLAKFLIQEIEQSMGTTWLATKNAHDPSFIRLEINPALADQEYRLDIFPDSPNLSDNHGIRIHGGSEEGLRYGVQTLRQIIRQCAPTLQVVHVEDQPIYKVRGYCLDVTRGRVPTLDWLKRWADLLTFYKYNQLHLYIEHAYAFEGMSETWRGCDPLNSDDIIAFDDYCAKRGLELVPAISTFGHQYMALRTEGLHELSEFPEDSDRSFSFYERQEHHTLNVTKPESFQFSTSLIDDYLPLFRSKFFNICADETFDLGKGRSSEIAKTQGIPAMYAQYVKQLCDYVASRGSKPMLWADIAVEKPEILDSLPHDAILLNWLYSPQVTENEVKLIADSGAVQYVCPTVHAWNCLLLGIDNAWENISRLSRYGQHYGAAGMLVTDWGDFGYVNDPRMSIPGMIYGAQCGWQVNSGGVDELNQEISRIQYGDSTGKYLDLIRASGCTAFGWDNVVSYVELYDGHGQTNNDVLQALNWKLADEPRSHMSTHPTLEEARYALIESEMGNIGSCVRYNQQLKQLKKAIGETISASTENRYDIAAPILVGIEGQQLLNRIGYALAAQHGLTEAGNSDSQCCSLASQLEVWFEQYRQVWRTVSRESELCRIGSIVWRLANLLRIQHQPKVSD